MEAVQAIGGGSFLLASAVLAVRLLLLAWRNRAVPELLLGLAFLCGGTLGAVMEASSQVAQGAHGLRADSAGCLLAIGKGFGFVGITCNCLFAWYVFRRHSRWAPALIAALVALQLSAYVGHANAGTFRTGVAQPLFFWLEFAGRIASPAWLGIEAFVYYGRMRRRSRIGLADPVVTNRFLLWGLASATGMVFLLTSVPPLYLAEDSLLVNADLLVFAAAGLVTAGLYWLAFFPPAAYRRRLVRAAAAA